MARNTTNNTTVVINLTTQGDGAKKATDQLEELKKKAEESDKQFEKFQKQTEATVKALEGLGATGAAGEVVKGLADAGKELNNLATLAQTFEMTWQFALGGAAKQAGGLSTALSSIPKTIQIAVIAESVLQISKAAVEAKKMNDAFDQEGESTVRYKENNDDRRKKALQLIDEAQNSGRIGLKQASDMRSDLDIAFTPKLTLPKMDEMGLIAALAPDMGGIGTPMEKPQPMRDLDAEFAATMRVFKTFTDRSGNAANEKQAALTLEQNKALEELAKLNQKTENERLQGYEKERAVVEADYQAQVGRINNLAQKNELNAQHKADVDKALAEQAETRDAKLAEIDARQAEEQKQYLEQIEQLKEQLTEASLTGLQKEILLEDERYQKEIDHINEIKDLTDQQRQELLALNDKAHEQAQKRFDRVRPTAEINQFENQLPQQISGSSGSRVDLAQREYQARLDFIDQLYGEEKITEVGYTQMVEEAATRRSQAIASYVAEGGKQVEMLAAKERGVDEQRKAEIAAHYEELKRLVNVYYDNEVAKAQGDAETIYYIEAERARRTQQLDEQQSSASSELYAGLKGIAVKAEGEFAAGFSHAFMSIIDGTKSAGQAFKEFAANFMKSVADMIMQLVILIALKSALKALGVPLGDGGMVASPAAKGGVFPGMTAAAAGVMLAAAGIQGVNEVNGPTYFPQFNVLAGEAGSEVMTVFSRPQAGTISGLPVITGNVGPDKLAILSQESLSQLVNGGGNATRAAAGYMGGSGIAGLGVASQTRQPDGRIVVELTPHPAYETRVIESSIAGARVAIASDLATDTPIRNQVKGVLS